MDLPKRKRNRLAFYDYNQHGSYFVTICTQNKNMLFRSSSYGIKMDQYFTQGQYWDKDRFYQEILTDKGRSVYYFIDQIDQIYVNVRIDDFVIMPNHIHLLITLMQNHPDESRSNISKIVQQFKQAVTKNIGHAIWQKSFHDHIIRNPKEYQKIRQYIENNPVKWADDCYYRADQEG